VTPRAAIAAARAFVASTTGIALSSVFARGGHGVQSEATSYAVVGMVGDIGDGGPETVAGLASVRSATEHRQITVQVDIYGEDCMGLAQRVAMMWRTLSPAAQTCRAAGLHPSGASTVSDLTGLGDSGMAPRARVDLSGYHRSNATATWTASAVETIVVDLDQTPGTLDVEATVEVP